MVAIMLHHSPAAFNALLFALAVALYINTLQGGYVWDDRAAIIANKDVQGLTPWTDLLKHDFWGQDIRLIDSHKSFRPVTVASFRLNHSVHGYNAAGFHALNVLIYAVGAVVFYWLAGQWVNDRVARVAALVFCCHPVHVEAVASLVGRADSLCGAFYLLAVYLYTYSIRAGSGRSSSSSSRSFLWRLLTLVLSFVAALGASFSKEIGVTVYGVFAALEALELLKTVVVSDLHAGSGRRVVAVQHLDMQLKSPTPIASLVLRCLTFPFGSWAGAAAYALAVLRIAVGVGCLAAILLIRQALVGKHKLYEWTVLENHVSLLPTLQERALSYAQTHFWYLLKLLFPRYLCFDYGFACIPTVHTWADPRNALPLAAYALVLGHGRAALARVRASVLAGLVLMLVPLVPALNVFLPVGTLLAERLLFVPSAGFSLLLAEALVSDLAPLWTALALATHAAGDRLAGRRRRPGAPAVAVAGKGPDAAATAQWLALGLAVTPLCALFGVRVVTRNVDWNREISIYRSALEVCPLSVKALTNYGVLALSEGRTTEAVVAIKTALSVYPGMKAAYVNLGLAQQRVGDLLGSIQSFEKAKQLYMDDGKAYAYLGALLLSWSSSPAASGSRGAPSPTSPPSPSSSVSPGASAAATAPAPAMDEDLTAATARALRQRAAFNMDAALLLGHEPPSLLHSRGSLAMDDGDNEGAVRYLTAALQKNEAERAKQDAAGTVTDGVNDAFTLNQLGNAYSGLGRADKAAEIFEGAVAAYPASLALRTNLGSIYRTLGRNDRARVVMEGGLDHCRRRGSDSGSGSDANTLPRCPAALLNNLGLLELDENFFARAVELFECALQEVGSHAEMRASDGGSAVKIMQGNLDTARRGLAAGSSTSPS